MTVRLAWTHTTGPSPLALMLEPDLPLDAGEELLAEWNELNVRSHGDTFTAAYTHTASRNGAQHLAPADGFPRA